MRRRVLATILSVAAITVLLFAVPLGLIVARLIDEQAALRLERQAVLAARNVPSEFTKSNDPAELPAGTGVDYALYGTDGQLVAGAGPSAADPITRQALANQVVHAEVGEALVVAIPVVGNERVVGAIRAEQPTGAIDGRRSRAISLISALGSGVLAVAAGLGWVLSGRLVRPIRELRDATVQLGTGDFAIRTPTSRVPEIAQTALALSATAERLDELITRERSFSADASHQLRTPLTAMRTTLETELAFPRPDPTVAITEVLGDIDGLELTIAELLDIARTTARPTAIELEPVLAGLADAWTPRIAAAGRSLHVDPGRYTPRVTGHPTMLRHALDVLIDNALVHGDGDITVSITNDDQTVSVTIADQGPGFAVDRLAGTRNETGRAARHAGGHGLPLAQRLVAAQHGRITVDPGTSGQVTIRLRRADAEV